MVRILNISLVASILFCIIYSVHNYRNADQLRSNALPLCIKVDSLNEIALRYSNEVISSMYQVVRETLDERDMADFTEVLQKREEMKSYFSTINSIQRHLLHNDQQGDFSLIDSMKYLKTGYDSLNSVVIPISEYVDITAFEKAGIRLSETKEVT
ncbi:MAG: hypothetical protein AAFQ94_18230 [Bacteroidota bacterium]